MRHLSFLLAAMLAAGPALAENRGVVIANGRYEHAPALSGADGAPASDALKAAGFRTVAGNNLIIGDVRQAIADLLRPDETPGARLVVLNGRFLKGERDSWFMGTDAERPGLLSAPTQGGSLGAIADLLGSADPGAVLLLGSDGEGMEHAAGLEAGIGVITVPEGVTVISGPPEAVTAAAVALIVPGASVGQVLAGDDRLVMGEGGDEALVLVEAVAANTPEANPPTATAAPSDSDRDLWAEAAATDSAAAYQDYLTRYPNGLYSAAAADRLTKLGVSTKSDRDLWAESAATNTAAAYAGYLSAYPKGEFAPAAERRLTEIRLTEEAAKPAPTPTPQGAAPAPAAPAPSVAARPKPEPARLPAGQVTENNLGLSRADRVTIQRRLNTLGYATGGADGVFGTRSRGAIRGWQQRNGLSATGYLTANQLALLRDQAGAAASSTESQDRQYWQRTGARGGVDNLRAYLDRYPNGIYAQNARDRLAAHFGNGQNGGSAANREDIAWTRARQLDTVQGYTTYLRNFPRGEHARQARQRRDRLIQNGNPAIPGTGGIGLNPEAIIRDLLR